jgi:UDP-N-acetylmuramoylalanine--D-glutamate ligase
MKSPKELSGKKICIVGFGVEGKAALTFLHKYGANLIVADSKNESSFDVNEITLWREKGVEFYFQSYPELYTFDYIVRSPGVSPETLTSMDVPVERITSVTQMFFDFCPAPIIGVTGTKGKGTTSSLIYEMLKASGKDAYLGGNIGTPALEFFDNLTSESVVVLELSSFQLLDLGKSPAAANSDLIGAKAMVGKPHIAVMLMITSEHLDYHNDVYEYVDAKRNIVRFQTADNYAILNRDYPASNESDLYTDAQLYLVSRDNELDKGCFVKDNTVVIREENNEKKVIDTQDILLPGKHNWENVCAAVMAAHLAGVDIKTIATILKTFKGLEHRLELVKTVKGVRYYDDSFSTTPETALAAIEAFEDPKILILGGSSKNSDFTELGKIISSTESIKAIIGVGEEWKRMKAQFPISNFQFPIIEECKNMEEIVQKASEVAELGDVVILSPACASFDIFKDYKDRGNQFKNAVNSL